MTRKIIAIFAALLLSLSFVACSEQQETTEETTATKIEITTDATTAETTEEETEAEETKAPSTSGVKDPGEYGYTDCNETLYVYINGGGEVTLRAADYEYLGTLKQGDKVTRIGVSNDADGYWSKVTVGGKTGYVASKFLSEINVLAPEGFTAVEKTVKIDPMTGSLNVREIPDMSGDIIAWVTSEAPVKVLAENTVSGWYQIETTNPEGKTVIGYIASNAEYFVKEETTTEATTAEVTEAETEAATEAETETETAAPAGK